MGSGVLQLFTLRAAPPIPNLSNSTSKFSNTNTSSSSSWCCFSTKYGGRTGGSQWERTRYHQYEDKDDDFFGFRNAEKQRIWWSDDSASSSWDLDEDDEEIYNGFGVLEGSIGFSSIFKVLRAFGWMVPAILISMLFGTGTNTFFMALALPLAQSALSMVFDALWGRSTDSKRPKSRTQKRAFTRAAANSKTRKEREQASQTGKRNGDYQSWVAANNVSAEKREGRRSKSFGGWDDLDKQMRAEEVPKSAPTTAKRQSSNGVLGRKARSRSTPLLVRLLIGFFPFLGFWTKLF